MSEDPTSESPPSEEAESHGVRHTHDDLAWNSRAFLALCVAATGVVYGDIGTSPLYTWSEIRRHGALEGSNDILGACSLIFWALTIIALGKYVVLVLRASNNGEGGTFALLSQVQPLTRVGAPVVTAMLVFASALLYGEGLITPAISVLSAVEGIAVIDTRLDALVVPLTLLLLTAVFAVQYQGSERVGRAFGGIMVVWFLSIAALGAAQVAQHPSILLSLSPHYGLTFLLTNGLGGALVILGSVVLCITGGEALFADMGHFGARSIRTAWSTLVYPSLLLSYFGQGALLLSGAPIVNGNVFFSMVPAQLQLPMVVLATCAAIIASQALITGAFSLTRMAVNIGLLPRVDVVHTNQAVEGQIYMPGVNWALWFGCCWLVIEFRSSTNLAAAYGLSVMGTMVTTSIAMAYIARDKWKWGRLTTVLVFGTFLILEGAFLASNIVKIPDGAWLPLAIGAVLWGLMQIWRRGRRRMADAYVRVDRFTVRQLLEFKVRLPELPRAMVFLTQEKVLSFDDPVPLVALKFVDRYGALPRHLTLFSIVLEDDVPYWRKNRFDVRQFGDNVTSVRMHVGYMETPNTRDALTYLKQQRQIRIHATRWTIVMGKEELILSAVHLVRGLPDVIFKLLFSLAGEAHRWYGLSTDTGLSKEVIAVRINRAGRYDIMLRKPDLDTQWVDRGGQAEQGAEPAVRLIP